MVVEQLNEISTNGFAAYDSIIGQEVLVMTSTLSFLADSPMHAEITDTHCPNQLRTTEETSKNSEELWTYTKETLNPDKLDKKVAELAVRDQINLKFSRQVFDFQQEK
ncbi:hypothetical protein KEM48_009232 [Puccinia striiformis f. sp. tritici PST-130]|nr:hypothetical protein H4Q26_009415 [Puccinia striiformis f. sp. tritici PST-130]KAI9624005.1 hypothetical protein KEM48_009232 [Puccinia striiformis f. sp. tritici PST-130]